MTTLIRTIEYPPYPHDAMAPKKLNIQLPRHIHRVVSKGREYYYFNPHRNAKNAPKDKAVRLPGTPQDPEFWAKLKDLTGIMQPSSVSKTPTPKTFDALIAEFKASSDFHGLGEQTKKDYLRYFDLISHHWGNIPVRMTKAKNVLWLRDQYANTPQKANYLLRVLSRLISWGVPMEYREDNPCGRVPPIKIVGTGWAPWPWEDIEAARDNMHFKIWAVLAGCLFTGQRISDVVKMKRSDIKPVPGSNYSVIGIVQNKTQMKLSIPVHQLFRPVMERCLKGNDTFFIFTNSRGLPWTRDGFETSFRKEKQRQDFERLRERGLVIHGLRKSAAVMLAESGCSDAEIQAITGQSKVMVEYYTRQVNQLKLARNAILKWEALLEKSRQEGRIRNNGVKLSPHGVKHQRFKIG